MMSSAALAALHSTRPPRALWWAVLWAPMGAVSMLAAMLSSAGADRRFIHTPHQHAVDVDELGVAD